MSAPIFQTDHTDDVRSRARRLWSRLVVLLLVGEFTLGLLVAAITGVVMFSLQQHALNEAGRELRGQSLLLADQAERTFEAVDLAQTALVERLQSWDIDTPPAFSTRMTSFTLHQNLLSRVSSLPQLEAIAVIDTAGDLINTSDAWPVTAVNVADSDYFLALKVDAAPPTFLGVRAQNSDTGTWTIDLARKATAPDGTFLGVVLATIRLNYFEHLYQQVATGPDQAIWMSRRDNVLLARYPHVDAFDRSFGDVTSTPSTEDPSIVVRERSQLDGRERLIATRSLQQYPVAVSVLNSVSAILTEWRRQAVYLASAAAIVGIVAVIVGILMLRHLRNQRRLGEALAAAVDAEFRLKIVETRERERQMAEAKVNHMAHHDALTGLPNRVLFHERLRQAIARGRRGEPSAMLYLDLDHFKVVNDTLGHPVGDALLCAVTERLSAEVREIDTVARLGGDEFAIIQSSARQPQDVTALSARLVEVLSAPYELSGHQMIIGTSIGIVMIPGDGDGTDELVKNVDLALYRAKADGRGCYRFFAPEMDAVMQARRTLEMDLRKALIADEFEVFYQPLMNIKTKSVSGFEALVRWRHPERGLLAPDSFIPLAEEIGVIVPLGLWVLRRACLDAASWPGTLKVAVNVSVIQFASRTLVDDVAAALATAGLAPNRLELEITETAMLEDTDAILVILYQLRELGVGIAMDDFGTGYSSLNYLRRFPFSKVKIDRSFISGLGGGGDCASIVSAVTELCETLGMMTVAEGVETEAQLEQLRMGNCSEAQGYLFSKPRPAADVALLCHTLGPAAAADELLISAA